MANQHPEIVEQPKKFRFDWLPGILFRPRRTLSQIAEQSKLSVWFLPMIILTLTAIGLVVVSGPIIKNNALMKGPEYPPDYQWWSPEQQTQFMKTFEAKQSPVFIYIFPGLVAVGKVWLGWLFVMGLLHLASTILGGRSSTFATANLVAWAAIPFGLRDIVQIIFILSKHQLILNRGLSGFAPQGDSNIILYLIKFLSLVDIYVFWYAALLIGGVRVMMGLSRQKTWLGVVVTILITFGIAALVSYGAAKLGSMNVSRPFFFF